MFERSFHFIPASRPEWFAGASSLGSDAVVFDLEDSVAGRAKAGAVAALREHLPGAVLDSSMFVRVNGAESTVAVSENDLLAAVPGLGIVLPKVDSGDDFRALMRQYPAANGRKIIVLIESPRGLENCATIADSAEIFALGLGLEDFLCCSVFTSAELADFVRHIRCRVATTAMARGCLAIDTVSLDTTGGAVLAEGCREARSCGLQAKFSIHPCQIATINAMFSPDTEALRRAQALAGHFEDGASVGYSVHEGKIVSPPALAKAKLQSNFAKTHAVE
jgi:citrate lyase beta subunit